MLFRSGIHSLSEKGIILWANDAELNSLGYTAEEYIGHPVTEVIFLFFMFKMCSDLYSSLSSTLPLKSTQLFYQFLVPGQDEYLAEVSKSLIAGKFKASNFKFLHKNGSVVNLSIDSNGKLCDGTETFQHTRSVLSVEYHN